MPVRPRIQREHLVEQQGDEEHPLGVTKVRDRKDDDARLAVRGIEQVRRVERFAVEPLLETGRGKDAVEAHRKIEAIALREERIQIDNTDLLRMAESAPAG